MLPALQDDEDCSLRPIRRAVSRLTEKYFVVSADSGRCLECIIRHGVGQEAARTKLFIESTFLHEFQNR